MMDAKQVAWKAARKAISTLHHALTHDPEISQQMARRASEPENEPPVEIMDELALCTQYLRAIGSRLGC